MNAINSVGKGRMRADDARKIIRRLEVKVDAMRLEFKATGHPRKHDMDEMLTLLDVLKDGLTLGART